MMIDLVVLIFWDIRFVDVFFYVKVYMDIACKPNDFIEGVTTHMVSGFPFLKKIRK